LAEVEGGQAEAVDVLADAREAVLYVVGKSVPFAQNT